MTSPIRSLAVATDQPVRHGWVGVSLSIVCFLHCAGAAAIVPLLPAAFPFLTENGAVEWGLLAVSAVLAGRLAWTQPRVPWALLQIWIFVSYLCPQ